MNSARLIVVAASMLTASMCCLLSACTGTVATTGTSEPESPFEDGGSTKDGGSDDDAGPIDAGVIIDAGPVGLACAFNVDCRDDERCECDEVDGCFCSFGPRGMGQVGVDACTDGNDCASSVCLEGPNDVLLCSASCATDDDCAGDLPICADIAFVGRICIRA